MNLCFFVSDLHGNVKRYQKLINKIKNEKPEVVFIGGDIFPIASLSLSNDQNGVEDFTEDFLIQLIPTATALVKEGANKNTQSCIGFD